jgi:hypothetical protein
MGEDKYPKEAFHHHSTGRRTKVDHVKEGNKAAKGNNSCKCRADLHRGLIILR